MNNLVTLKSLLIIGAVLVVIGCTENTTVEKDINNPILAEKPVNEVVKQGDNLNLDVYKSPTCGCCKTWMSHIQQSDIAVQGHDTDGLSQLKFDKGIRPQYQSCHTAISPEGYVFEGHVPAKFIHQFLAQEHSKDVIGLSVPAMPVGSPGMEMGDKFMPYQVLLLKSDGSALVYASLNSYEEQF